MISLAFTAASCKELLDLGNTETKLYQIELGGKIRTVYCDMEDNEGRGGGWTVIQRRGDYGNPPGYFFRNWTAYKEGFGDPSEDHWLGLDAIHSLAPGDNGVQVQLMISMEVKLKQHIQNIIW